MFIKFKIVVLSTLLLLIVLLKISIVSSFSISSLSSSPSPPVITPPSYDINFQIHSWNDLEEWDQMYKKGTIWNKIDLHFMDSSFCASQNINDTRGCFVLSHDAPAASTRYNTSIDVVSYIVNNNHWYQSPHPPKYMALCFKLSTEVKECSNTTVSNNYIELVTELVNNFTVAINANNLALEVILDGSGAPISDCLIGMWTPLVSTWIGHPWEAVHSNNETLGYNRFQVLDLPIEPIIPGLLLDLMCMESPPFGKFSGPNASYPVLVWEPSNQATIDSVAQSYINCQQKHTNQLFSELRYATNIDPAQMLVYLGIKSSKTSWNVRLDSMSPINSRLLKDIYEPTTQQQDQTLPTPSKTKTTSNYFNSLVVVTELEEVLFTMALFTNQTGNYYYHLLVSKGEFGQLIQIGTFALPLGNRAALLFARMISNELLLTYDENSGYVVYKLEATNSNTLLELTTLVYGVLPNNMETSFISSTVDVLSIIDNNNSTSAQLVQYYATSTCSLGVITWSVPLSRSAEPTTIYGPTCLIWSNNLNYRDLQIDSMSAVSSNSQSSDTCIYDGIVSYGLSTSINIGAVYVCIHQDLSVNISAGPTILDVGSNPQLSIAQFNGIDHVMLVHDQGYCFNTESRNKRPSPRVCESSALIDSNSKVLNYAYGLFTDYLLHVEQSTMITACDKSILHGVFDQGTYPSVSLFNTFDQAIGEQTLGVISLHQGVSSTFIDTSECGAPTSHNDLVLDSWPLYPFLI